MVVVSIKGRLGNQMFGFALYRQLLKMGKEVYVDFLHEPLIDFFAFQYNVIDKETALEYLKDRDNRNIIKRWEYRIFPQRCLCYEEKATGVFDKNVLRLDEVYLNGYWQSERYFSDVTEEIRRMYRFPDLLTDYQQKMLDEIQSKQSVSMHIRRGDYLEHPELYGTITMEYYDRAMRYIQERKENVYFYIFTNDIPWAMQNFKRDNTFIIEDSGHADTGNLDMALMAACKDNIIANSSFSWWGAWLNRNQEKIVIAPKEWEVNRSTRDIWCKGWLKM